MAASSSVALRWAPRRICCSVKSAKSRRPKNRATSLISRVARLMMASNVRRAFE